MSVAEMSGQEDGFVRKPTWRQEKEARRRAFATGRSMAPLRSVGQASRAIGGFDGVEEESSEDRRRERHEIADEVAAGPRLATDFLDEEFEDRDWDGDWE